VAGAADAAAQRTALGLTIGSNVQAWDADLDAIAAISTTGPIERTGAGTWAVSDRIRLFGGNKAQNNYTSTNNDFLNLGVYYFNNFTILTGHTITISQFARIYCSDTFTVQSGATIVVSTGITSSSTRPGLPGSNLRYLGGEGTFGPNCTYNPYLFPLGAAGGGGRAVTGSPGSLANVSTGGAGGGAIWVEATGAITISGTITALGGNGLSAIGGSDLFVSGGSGGGSGGAIMLSSLVSITIASIATLSVRGGNGTNGATSIQNSKGFGGNGGSGGWIWLTAPTVTTTGSTITLSGGSAGSTATLGSSVTNWAEAGYGGSFAGNGGYTEDDGVAGAAGILVTRTFKGVA
jgi:hypothetical protein